MTDLITRELVRLDTTWGDDKLDVIRGLAAVVSDAGRAADTEQLIADAFAREETSSTGLPGGIAIPHCRTTGVEEPTLAFARLRPRVDFGAKDGPADLAFLIAAPAGGDATHLQLLTKLARSLVKPSFTNALREAEDADEVVALIQAALDVPDPARSTPAAASVAAATPAAATAVTLATGGPKSLVAVTACPTGIAHTYMAAEALEAAAGRAGIPIQVETQGSAGSTPLSPETIANASAVIFAVDVGVRDRSRFAGKPMVSSGVKRPIDDADTMIAEALRYADDPSAPRVEGTVAEGGEGATGKQSFGATARRVLMTGVSYMIPFVAAGGLLIALSFLLGGYEIALQTEDGAGVSGLIIADSSLLNLPDTSSYDLAGDATLPNGPLLTYLGALLLTLGGAAFGFLVPALAGYIAYAIADRPGIAPGFVMGAIAGTLNSGFLGGIIGGVLAGMVAHWIAGWRVPTWMRGLMPVLVIPLLATLIVGFVMVVVLGKPLASLMANLSDGLNSLQGGSAIILGIILGLMMAFDMGGPLNKTAYAFAVTGLGAAATATDAPELRVMAAVMLAGMVPPLALALATVLRPGLFTVPERENGKAAWAMGASFITEGAIPFAAADPLRVIPSIMAGSAVTGALAMSFDVSLRAPHGGIFVLFAVDGVWGFLIALVAGTLVAAALVITLKSIGDRDTDLATV
ncbi:PTS fructose transporter subunit IIABC [Nocardioides terrigena]|uniref:PTS fructose transporter subunit IIABC n=1 Tax=Nocardioides terrigena TaxID=424797 RepID=UPI000D2F5C78|nr:fructose-specific PTS transporter subunit EIIC [Nocardioides terrigena]